MKNNNEEVIVNIDEVIFEEIDVSGCMTSMTAAAE